MNALARLKGAVEAFRNERDLTRVYGAVSEILPSHYLVDGLSADLKIGDCVRILAGERPIMGQAVSVGRGGASVKSFENSNRVGIGARVERVGPVSIAPHDSWIGRVINALGEPVDEEGPLHQGARARPVDGPPPQAMQRRRVSDPIRTGVRVIDCFTPLCKGQRIGVFAGSGVGKSTLLSMMTRAEGFDAAVVCLVGERGREVRDFLEHMRETSGAAVVTVVATGDESPMMRRLAPLTAMTIAESMRDEGASVLLIVDSVTRYAHASREVALAAGEPPVAHGFTPSVFADLPRLLERAGPGDNDSGAITGIFSVLVDGDNHNDPVADCIRGTLDGHVVLEREIAEQGRYPAINVLKSISRLADRVWSPGEREFVSRLKTILAKFEDTKDLRMLGGYQPGSDRELDQAVAVAPIVYAALVQSPESERSENAIQEIAGQLREHEIA
jgi:flagellum-specific ATP synthase